MPADMAGVERPAGIATGDLGQETIKGAHAGPCLGERMCQAQARELEVGEPEVLAAETERGKALDARVEERHLLALKERSYRAQLRFLDEVSLRRSGKVDGLRVLLAPTSRTMDHLMDSEALKILAQRLINSGELQALKKAVNDGPRGGGIVWQPPSTPVELVASILRWAALTDHDKRRIPADSSVRKWISETLADARYDTQPRLGGITAVCTELGQVCGHVPTMMALGNMPPEIARRLPEDTRVIGSDPRCATILELPPEKEFSGNFCLGVRKGKLELPDKFGPLVVNGLAVDPAAVTEIDILITGTASVQGFTGLAGERLGDIGRAHDMVVLTGSKELSSEEKIRAYVESVSALHSGGCAVALFYSESKFPSVEVEFWRELKKRHCVESFGLNCLEAEGILERIQADVSGANQLNLSGELQRRVNEALKIARSAPEVWEDGHESPEWIFESALLLQDILEIPVVRVRGMLSDIVVVKPGLEIDPESVGDYQFASRDLGSVKVADPSGLFERPDDMDIVTNVPDGQAAAALFKILDRMSLYNSRLGKGPSAASDTAEEFMRTCHACLADGRFVFAAVPVPFYIKDGGTQSAGDVMDFTFATSIGGGLLRKAYIAEVAG